jgi:hypothetical protein
MFSFSSVSLSPPLVRVIHSVALLNTAPDKQAKIFGDNFQVTFEALKERRTNVLERRTSKAERKKSYMETLKGPIVPPNGVTPQNGAPVPNSAASRTRGKAPKPKVTSIDFANGHSPPNGGQMNQVNGQFSTSAPHLSILH